MTETNKKIVSFNVKADTYSRFKEWCEGNGTKMSPLIDDMINEFINSQEEGGEQ